MKSHDLSLPAWGPYSKRYGGISHIPSLPGGRRFDLSVFPSLYRRGVTLPNVMWESGYHPWDCSGDLSRYTHRHELLWKDRLYTEVSFSREEDDLARFACRTVNRSGVRQAVVFHLMGALHFPPLETYSAVPVRDMAPPAGEGLIYRDALDYAGLRFREDSPRRTLSPDGIIWGEVRDHGFTGGSGLGGGFGEREDDEVLYALPGEWDRTGRVWLRFRSEGGTGGKFLLDGGLRGETPFSGTGDWQILCLECRPGSEEEVRLKITGGAAADLDGLVFASPALREMPRFAPRNLNPRPEILPGPGENSLILKYESLENYYGLSWDVPGVVRHWDWGEPDNPMKHNVHEHNNREFPGDGKGHYTEVFTRPVYLEEGSERINGGMICTGDREEVRRILARETGDGHALWTGFTPEERFFPEDSPYAFSVNRLAATALLNVVYPVRLLGGWIRGLPLHLGLRIHRPGIRHPGSDPGRGDPEHLPDRSGQRERRLHPPRQPGAHPVLPLPGDLQPDRVPALPGEILRLPPPLPPLHGRPGGELHHGGVEIGPAQDLGLFLQLRGLGRLLPPAPCAQGGPGGPGRPGDNHLYGGKDGPDPQRGGGASGPADGGAGSGHRVIFPGPADPLLGREGRLFLLCGAR